MNPITSEEKELLDAASSRIDEEIQTLCIQRALLRRRVNSLRDQSFILPPETLTTIFEYAVHGNVQPILSLGAVCFRWRQVVWASPSLWTSIDLCSKQSGAWKLFDLHLENSKDVSISIHLPTDHNFATSIHPLLELTHAAFIKSSNRVRVLNIGPIDRFIWDVVAPYSTRTNFPRLEAVKFDFGQDFDLALGGGLFCRSPLLRSIDMTKPLPGIERYLPLHQLTSLSLRKLSPTYSLYLLSQCPNLIDFRSQDVLPCVSADETFALEASATLQNLQSLRWQGDIPPSATFITDIHLPSVQELFWQGHLDTDICHVWQPFFSTMTTVRVLDCSYTVGMLDLLNSIPSVEVVHIRFSHLFNQLEEITQLISHLDLEKNIGLLPRLTQFALTLEEKDEVMSKERLPFQEMLIQMVTSRRHRGNGHTHASLQKLSLKVTVPVVWGTWHRHLVESLRQLDDEGLIIAVT